jgi:hypothetical protein
VILSPPFTIFSFLQASNWNRMQKGEAMEKLRAGIHTLDIAIWVAAFQQRTGRAFIFEHPAGAASWKRDNMKQLLSQGQSQLLTTQDSIFDQCMFGLKSPNGVPMRKRTTLRSNIDEVFLAFGNMYCDKSHQHETIQGSVKGVNRSTHAQHYPRGMCLKLAEVVHNYCDRAK